MRVRELVLPFCTFESDRKWYGALAVSTALHLSLLAGLCLWQAKLNQPPAEFSLDTRWQSDAGETYEQLAVETVELQEQTPTPGGSSAIASIAAAQPVTPADAPSVAAPVSDELAMWSPGTAAPGLLSEHVGTGNGKGSGDGDGASTAFFGQTMQARRVVYVLDASRSMNYPHPSLAKTRFGRVKLELVDSIKAMEPGTEFFIIFFNERAHPMPARGLVRVDRAEPYLNWMAVANADGHTDPAEALLMALRLQPDVICFLSDGDFRPGVVADVSRLNQDQIAIHTFCLGDRTGEPLMKQIAGITGGRYRFIP